MHFNLRPYQATAEQQARIALAGGCRRIVLYLPTGAGKTLTATSIITKAVAKGRKVAFVANRKQLVAQTSAVLARYGIAHGILQADNTARLHERVLVASIDTVAVRGLPDDMGLIIIDEAHAVAGSAKYRRLLAKYSALPVVGLTATPFAAGMARHYPELHGPLFEHLVVGATIKDLIAGGYLVDLDVFGPPGPDLTGVRTTKGIDGLPDYNQTQLEAATDLPELVGDISKHWLRLAHGRQTVVFATSIPHSKHIVEEFLRAGIRAEHIDYHFEDEERAAVLDRFARGETTVLSNVGLLAEGWDCPECEVMILARPTKSLIRFVQMVGRVLRPAPGKERALLLDHSGSTARLGHPCDDLPLILDDGKPRSASGGQREKKEPLPTPCPSCHFMRPPRVHVCPKCHFAPERQNDIEVADGELVRLQRKKPVQRDSAQFVYSQLLAYAAQRGYRRGWAWHKFSEFFDGRHPSGLRQVPAAPTPELLGWIKHRQIAAAKEREKQEAGHATT
jgi:superfamily II DNA or RNA helicase